MKDEEEKEPHQTNAKPQIHFTRPRDESLQAFKDWVSGMVRALNPNAKNVLTEEEWESRWREFWKKAKE